jgi:hypothetical protein
MNIKKGLAGLILASTLSLGCASYKVDTPDYIRPNAINYLTDYHYDSIRNNAKEHYLYKIVPLSSDQIKPYDIGHWLTWTFLGNEKNGIFGEDCGKPYSENINTLTFVRWNLRNPMANFGSYVVGRRTKERKGFAILRINDKFLFMKKDENPCIFSSAKASFNLAFNHYKPYLSFKFPVYKNRRFDCSIGWKPDNTLSFKFRPFTDSGLW